MRSKERAMIMGPVAGKATMSYNLSPTVCTTHGHAGVGANSINTIPPVTYVFGRQKPTWGGRSQGDDTMTMAGRGLWLNRMHTIVGRSASEPRVAFSLLVCPYARVEERA